jgi:hypothetical protein
MTGVAFPFLFNGNLFVLKYYLPFLVPFLLFLLKHLGLWERKARPPPKTSAPQPNAHIDKSARPGDRPGPGILRPRPVKIISIAILNIQLRHTLLEDPVSGGGDFFKNGQKI